MLANTPATPATPAGWQLVSIFDRNDPIETIKLSSDDGKDDENNLYEDDEMELEEKMEHEGEHDPDYETPLPPMVSVPKSAPSPPLSSSSPPASSPALAIKMGRVALKELTGDGDGKLSFHSKRLSVKYGVNVHSLRL